MTIRTRRMRREVEIETRKEIGVRSETGVVNEKDDALVLDPERQIGSSQKGESFKNK
jgi:hypothetical protein